MRDPFFFLSIAGLALSVAGFAGLVSAFRGRDQSWTRTELWRLRTIARLSFLLVFMALLPWPLYALTGDEPLVIRIVSGLIALAYLLETVEPRFDRVNWPGRTWVSNAVVSLIFGAIAVVNLAAAQTGRLLLRTFEPPVIDA